MQAFGVLHGGNHIGCAPAGGDADQHVVGIEIKGFKIVDAERQAIFGVLHRLQNGAMAAGNEADNLLTWRTVSGRTFAGIQNT